jgi:hypothetical protein
MGGKETTAATTEKVQHIHIHTKKAGKYVEKKEEKGVTKGAARKTSVSVP